MLIHEAFVAADMKTPHIPTDPLPTSPRPESQALIQSCQGDPFPGVLCAVSHLAAFMMQCSCFRAVSGEAHGPMRSQALLLHSPPAPGLFLPTLASIKEALATGSWASHTHPWPSYPSSIMCLTNPPEAPPSQETGGGCRSTWLQRPPYEALAQH